MAASSYWGPEHRTRPRARLSQRVRVRPSQPQADNFDDALFTENCCRDGFYFSTHTVNYRKHMRLFVVFPFSTVPGSINREYVGKISRVAHLKDGRMGVAVQLLAPISLSVVEYPTAVGRLRANAAAQKPSRS